MRLASTLTLVLLVAVISSAIEVVERSEIEEVKDDQPNQERKEDRNEKKDDTQKITVTLVDKDNNKEYKVPCYDNQLIIGLKDAFREASGLPTTGLLSRRRFIYKNESLHPYKKIKQYGIRDGDCIDIYLNPVTEEENKKENSKSSFKYVTKHAKRFLLNKSKLEEEDVQRDKEREDEDDQPEKEGKEEDDQPGKEREEDVTGKEMTVTLVDKRDNEEYEVTCNEEDLIYTIRNNFRNFVGLPTTGLYSSPTFKYRNNELNPFRTLKQSGIPDGAVIDVYPNPVQEEKKAKKKTFKKPFFKSPTKQGKRFSQKNSKIEEEKVDQTGEEREEEGNQPEREREEENDQPEKERKEEDDRFEKEWEEEEDQPEKLREEEMNDERHAKTREVGNKITVTLVDEDNNKEYKVPCYDNQLIIALKDAFREASGLPTTGLLSRRMFIYKNESLHPYKNIKQYGISDGAYIYVLLDPVVEEEKEKKFKKFIKFVFKQSKKFVIKKKSTEHKQKQSE